MKCKKCENENCRKLKEYWDIEKPCLFIGNEQTCIYFEPVEVKK